MPIHLLWVKNSVEITLSRTISEINVFLRFTQKFMMAAKNGKENDFWGNAPVDSADILQVKISSKKKNRGGSKTSSKKKILAFS